MRAGMTRVEAYSSKLLRHVPRWRRSKASTASAGVRPANALSTTEREMPAAAASNTLQSEAGYIDARPQSRQIDENATHGRTIHWRHSRRFFRVRATSGYPPNVTVKANRRALSPGAAALRPRTKFQIREETLSEGMRSRGRATTSDRFRCTPDRCHLSATPKSGGVGPILLQK